MTDVSRNPRYLIVNADDFGWSDGVNRGIFTAHEQGIVTSASLMVHWPAAAAAADYARGHPDLSLGLHLDLGEWFFREPDWICRYEVVPTDDATAVAAEVTWQLDAFRELTGQQPTHLDSHQHVHLGEPVRSIVGGMADAHGIPVRHFAPGVCHCGDFYGQSGKGLSLPEQIHVDALLRILAACPPGVTELACHPGDGDHPESAYNVERAQEVQALCDSHVRAALQALGITLLSFHDLARV
jgi:predicted glycoside hydrolase/deacetylase ChbG (UPF0249 family)